MNCFFREIFLCITKKILLCIDAVVGQGHKHVIVNATVVGSIPTRGNAILIIDISFLEFTNGVS